MSNIAATKIWFVQAIAILVIVIAPAHAQNASPAFTDFRLLTNQEMALKFTAPAGLRYRVDGSTNFPDWSPLATLVTASVNLYTDSAAPYFPARLYRALELTNKTALTGDHVATEAGEIVIHPLNHATFVLTWNGKTIYNDPVSAAGPFTGLPRADLILISHEHTDHFDASALTAIKSSNTVIIATKTIYNTLSAGLKAITTVLTNGASTNLLGLTVEAIPAYNLTANFHTKGVGNGYVLTIAGRRLYISGDTQDIPEMRALKDIDIAFLCVNLPYTMTVARAVSAIREFRPKIVYPYHYQGSPVTDLNALKQQVGSDQGIEVRLRKWY